MRDTAACAYLQFAQFYELISQRVFVVTILLNCFIANELKKYTRTHVAQRDAWSSSFDMIELYLERS